LLDYLLSDVGMSEAELWSCSWLAVDVRSRYHDRQDWQRWNHTRHLLAAWCGKEPAKLMPLPLDYSATKARKVAPPTLTEEMRARAAALLPQ
jgi:hypothetical protein